MGRPRIGEAPLVKMTIMISPAMLDALTAMTVERQHATPHVQIERSAICRELLAEALEARNRATAPPVTTSQRPARKGTSHAA